MRLLSKSKFKVHTVADMWQAFVAKKLAENPNMFTRFGVKARMKNYFLKERFINKEGKKDSRDVISYKEFKNIVMVYFSEAKTVIIAGEELSLGNKLGFIAARRVQRNFNRKVVNFAESSKYGRDENGKLLRKIYFTDDDWCRIGWVKPPSKNLWAYAFFPTPDDGTGKGFIAEFVKALRENPLLKFEYKFYQYYKNGLHDD